MIRRKALGRGKTVAAAIDAALEQLLVSADQAKIEVVDPGSKGFLGLGSREAVVQAVLVVPPAEAAAEVVRSIAAAAGYQVKVEAHDQQGTTYVNVAGDSLGELIGRRGRTLDALQYLVGLACARLEDGPRQVILDIGNYRVRREAQLERIALKAAETARRGRKVILEPMTAAERRLVHLALQDVADIETHSEGDEPYRKVVVSPTGGGGRRHA